MLEETAEGGFEGISQIAALLDAEKRGIVIKGRDKADLTTFGKWLMEVNSETDGFGFDAPILEIDKSVEQKLTIINKLFDEADDNYASLGFRIHKKGKAGYSSPKELPEQMLAEIGISKDAVADLKKLASSVTMANPNAFEEKNGGGPLLKKILASRLVMSDKLAEISLTDGDELKKIIESGENIDLGMTRQFNNSAVKDEPFLNQDLIGKKLSDDSIKTSAHLVSFNATVNEWIERQAKICLKHNNGFNSVSVTSQLFNKEVNGINLGGFHGKLNHYLLGTNGARNFYKTSPILTTLPKNIK